MPDAHSVLLNKLHGTGKVSKTGTLKVTLGFSLYCGVLTIYEKEEGLVRPRFDGPWTMAPKLLSEATTWPPGFLQ